MCILCLLALNEPTCQNSTLCSMILPELMYIFFGPTWNRFIWELTFKSQVAWGFSTSSHWPWLICLHSDAYCPPTSATQTTQTKQRLHLSPRRIHFAWFLHDKLSHLRQNLLLQCHWWASLSRWFLHSDLSIWHLFNHLFDIFAFVTNSIF